jgi:hypothetical protein
MASSSLVDRFQALQTQKKTEEFQAMSYQELADMRITFGETKLNQKFITVIEEDPKYTQWFARKYQNSQKESHQAFLYFLQLYVERKELETEEIKPMPNSVFHSGPDLAFVTGSAEKETPNAKRCRLAGKFSPEQLFIPCFSSSSGTPVPDQRASHAEEHRPRLNQIMHLAEQCAPRVGKIVVQDGPIFQQVQELYPDKQIGDSCGYRFQPGVTRLTTGLVILTWSCARVTSVTYPRQTGGEPLVKGDDCFGSEFE